MIKQIYLDHAAATPMDERVLKVMTSSMANEFENPSAIYLSGRAARSRMAEYRHAAARQIGARPAEVIFVPGSTEANNLALYGIGSSYPGSKILISAIEHPSVSAAAQSHAHKVIPVDKNGLVDESRLASLVEDDVSLISVIYANNEFGTIQNLKNISRLVASVRQERRLKGNDLPLLLHTDAVQAAQYLDIKVDKLGVDLMTIGAAKLYGPKQIALLYCRGGASLTALVKGGGQERGIRSGTENIAAMAGLVAALELSQSLAKAESRRLKPLAIKLIAGCLEIPDSKLIGHPKQRLVNNVAVSFAGIDGESAVMMLDEHGIQCSTGAACSARNEEASVAIKAMGYSNEQAASTLRFSLGRSTSVDDIDRTVDLLKHIVSKLRSSN